MYQVSINGKINYEVTKNGREVSVNGDAIIADIRQLNNSTWHIIKDFKSYNAEVISFNHVEKTAEIIVDGNKYTIFVKDQFDILLDKLGLSNLNAIKVSDVKAPMPGMVLKVFVTEGMEIKKGDNLFVLEAMKMENIIKSPADVTVRSVKIKPGDKIEKGQVLMIF